MTKLLLAAALLARAAPPAAASTCGVKGTDTTEWGAGSGQRIVNGQEATSCEWKWQACLKTPGQRQCWCGGTLISETWVLTAAHCVHSEGTTSAADSFSIMLGDFNHYQSGEMGSGEQEISVKNVIPHENYNEQTMDYDYALVELATPAVMTSCVGTACLPTEDDALTAGEECYISGWGTLSEGGSQPDNIQEAKVSIVDSSDCNTRYGGGIDETTMLCAQGTDDKGNIVDACQGDSGGPLVCEKDGTWYVHGATSWGYGCAAAQYPGIWARVTSELDWINGHVNAAPTPATPSPPITPAPTLNFDGSLFIVIDGECTVDESSCALSPNYPSNYGPDQTCSIAVDQDRAEPIHVMVFDTEADWDMLTVNGQVYSGSTGPGGVLPTATITWSSDFMIEQGGWRLCPLYQQFPTTAPTPAPPTHAPTPVPPTPPPTHFQCGVKGEDNTPWIGARIVNGQEASACEWTWQVGLKSAGGFGESFCGGTLIDKRWVLTAAHCVGEASFTIMAGVFDRTPGNEASEPVILQVANAFRHPDYDPSTFNMDFALVQLAEDAPLGDCIGTACLPDADLPVGSTCYISGWGTMTVGGQLSSTLQEAEMTMLSNEDCSMKYKGIWNVTWPNVTTSMPGSNMSGSWSTTEEYSTMPAWSTTVPAPNMSALSTTMDNNDDSPAMSTTMGSGDWSWEPITDNMTCAEGVLNGVSTGACQGDAGGPLVCINNETGFYELHGVTSWSYGCADTDYPGVWARVTSARDWIQKSMDNPPDPPTPHPPMSDGETWTVASGDCVISGDCLESPNYPEEYANEQACTILLSPSNTMAIEVSAFQTEESYDLVWVDGNWFSGGEGQGPDGVVPTSMITWSSDYTVTAGGWKLCLVEGPGESACQDELVNNGAGGLMPWHDADGDQYTCSWYDGTNSCDELWVDNYPNFGMSANQACCACGGGGYDGGYYYDDSGYYYDDGGNETGLGSEGLDDVTTSTDSGLGTDEDLLIDVLSFASRPVAFSCYLLACALAVAWAA